MARHPFTLPVGSTRTLLIAAIIALAAFAGCGNDDNPAAPGGGTPAPTTTTFSGVMIGTGSENGTITVTVATTSLAGGLAGAPVTASGTVNPTGSATVPLTGTYDAATDSLHLSGGGYTLEGEYDDNPSGDAFKSIAGGYTGPNGNGFFAAVLQGAAQVRLFVGTFENQTTTISGKWDMVVADTLAGCIAFPDGGTIDDVVPMVGRAGNTGTSRAITLAGGSGTLTVTASGTWNTTTDSVSGTWNSNDTSGPTTDTGTWAGEERPIPVYP